MMKLIITITVLLPSLALAQPLPQLRPRGWARLSRLGLWFEGTRRGLGAALERGRGMRYANSVPRARVQAVALTLTRVSGPDPDH